MSASSSNNSDGQVAADLRAAADVLERDGWTRRSFHSPQPNGSFSHCAAGAIALAVGDHNNLRVANGLASWDCGVPMQWLRRELALGKLSDTVGEFAWDWTDAPSRTAAEVIAALRAAADRAEAQS